MPAVVLQLKERHWECPNCDQTAVTVRADVHTEFHTCPGAGFLSVPFVEAGTRAKVECREREDYIGKELVTLDAERRPIMAAVVTRDEGQDCAVFAPCARGGRE